MTEANPWQWPEAHWRALTGRVRAGRALRPPVWKGGARAAVALSFDSDHETNELRDVRAGIQAALDVATKWNWDNTKNENDEAYAKVRALGKKVYDITPEQRALWVQAVQPVWKEFGAALVGNAVMNRLRQISQQDQ